MKKLMLGLIGLFVLLPSGRAQELLLAFPPKDENFTKGWQERVALEFEVVNAADLKSLRTALKDQDPFVRAMARRGDSQREGVK